MLGGGGWDCMRAVSLQDKSPESWIGSHHFIGCVTLYKWLLFPKCQFSIWKRGYGYLFPKLKAFDGRASLEMHTWVISRDSVPSNYAELPGCHRTKIASGNHSGNLTPRWSWGWLSPFARAQPLEPDPLINAFSVHFRSVESTVSDTATFLRRGLQSRGHERTGNSD